MCVFVFGETLCVCSIQSSVELVKEKSKKREAKPDQNVYCGFCGYTGNFLSLTFFHPSAARFLLIFLLPLQETAVLM